MKTVENGCSMIIFKSLGETSSQDGSRDLSSWVRVPSGSCPWIVGLLVSTIAVLLSFLPRQCDWGLTLTWHKFCPGMLRFTCMFLGAIPAKCSNELALTWVPQSMTLHHPGPLNWTTLWPLNPGLCIPVPCFSTSFDDCLSFLQPLLAAANLESLSVLHRPAQKDLFHFTTVKFQLQSTSTVRTALPAMQPRSWPYLGLVWKQSWSLSASQNNQIPPQLGPQFSVESASINQNKRLRSVCLQVRGKSMQAKNELIFKGISFFL